MQINNTANIDPLAQLVNIAFGGGIEAQEARGQRELVQSSQIPKRGSEKIVQFGGEILGPCDGDDLFVNARLPEGWEKKATDHSMWSDLVDAQGRKRGGIFYKAAFYDRDAHMSVCPRYTYFDRPLGGYNSGSYDYETTPKVGQIIDSDGNLLWESEPVKILPGLLRPYEASEVASNMAKAKIEEMFPDYKDPTAYWD